MESHEGLRLIPDGWRMPFNSLKHSQDLQFWEFEQRIWCNVDWATHFQCMLSLDKDQQLIRNPFCPWDPYTIDIWQVLPNQSIRQVYFWRFPTMYHVAPGFKCQDTRGSFSNYQWFSTLDDNKQVVAMSLVCTYLGVQDVQKLIFSRNRNMHRAATSSMVLEPILTKIKQCVHVPRWDALPLNMQLAQYTFYGLKNDMSPWWWATKEHAVFLSWYGDIKPEEVEVASIETTMIAGQKRPRATEPTFYMKVHHDGYSTCTGVGCSYVKVLNQTFAFKIFMSYFRPKLYNTINEM